MKSFKLFKESIIDIPRRTYAPSVFDDEVLYSFANFLIGIGNKKDSIKFLKKILNENPNHSMSYYLFSTIVNVEKYHDIANKIIKDIENEKL